MPNDFKEMVQQAISDELGAVTMFTTMANMVTDPTMKRLLMNIAGDETGHALTWMALLPLDA